MLGFCFVSICFCLFVFALYFVVVVVVFFNIDLQKIYIDIINLVHLKALQQASWKSSTPFTMI